MKTSDATSQIYTSKPNMIKQVTIVNTVAPLAALRSDRQEGRAMDELKARLIQLSSKIKLVLCLPWKFHAILEKMIFIIVKIMT
jgi:hypothetical protein